MGLVAERGMLVSDGESHFSLFSSFTKPPRLLYHYTSMEGLLGIGRSGKIYASDTRYLNDSTDSAYVFNFLENHIAQRISGGTDHDQNSFSSKLTPLC
jgi:hypothetical protein